MFEMVMMRFIIEICTAAAFSPHPPVKQEKNLRHARNACFFPQRYWSLEIKQHVLFCSCRQKYVKNLCWNVSADIFRS